MAIVFSTLAKTTLSADLGTGVTTCTFTDGSVFNAPGANDYEILYILDDEFAPSSYEIISLTDRTGNSGTITRAQEGTSQPANWPAGTVVAARISAGMLESFAQVDGDGDARGADALNLQSGRTADARVASGARAFVVGYDGQAAGPDSAGIAGGRVTSGSSDRSLALGYGAIVSSGDDAFALGNGSNASGNEAYAIGPGALANSTRGLALGADAYLASVADVTVLAGPLMGSVLDFGNASGLTASADAQFRMLSTAKVVLRSDQFSLLSTGTVTVGIPSGVTFFPDEVGIIATRLAGIGGSPNPEVSFGITGNNTALLASTELTIAANRDRDRFTSLVTYNGSSTDLTVEVTVAGTGSLYSVRAYWVGMLIQNEVAW